MTRITLLICIVWIVAGCTETGTTPESSTAVRAEQIICHTAYRSSTAVPIEGEEVMTFADRDEQQMIRFAELDFHAQYASGELDRERALRLWATLTAQAEALTSQLYQLPLTSGPQNQFVGGHGFTGLNYVYHPLSGAELQFWCTAETAGANETP